jgi:hypothetical protein
LIAVKIPHKGNNDDNIGDKDNNTNNIQPEQENIKILNPINPKQQIIFQYSREKYIQIDNLTSNESSKNHWAARAIKDGHTILTNDEMEDFLKMIQTSTFAIFKIRIQSTTTASSSQLQQRQQHELIGLYFLAILSYNDDTLRSLSWLPNKSNSNNNNDDNSVQSDEAFSSLYNQLINISDSTIPMVNTQSSSSN